MRASIMFSLQSTNVTNNNNNNNYMFDHFDNNKFDNNIFDHNNFDNNNVDDFDNNNLIILSGRLRIEKSYDP